MHHLDLTALRLLALTESQIAAWAYSGAMGLDAATGAAVAALIKRRAPGAAPGSVQCRPAQHTRDLTVAAAGGSPETTYQVQVPTIVTGWRAAFWTDNAADVPGLVRIRLRSPSGDYLLGDSTKELDGGIGADVADWIPFGVPLIVAPGDLYALTGTTEALTSADAGYYRVTFNGIAVHGL